MERKENLEMHVNRYTEYSSVQGDLSSVVQIPDSMRIEEVQVIIKSGNRQLILSVDDFLFFDKSVVTALRASGVLRNDNPD